MTKKFIVLLAAMTLAGCRLVDQKFITSVAPDDRTVLTIWQIPHPPDSSIRITLRRSGFDRTIYRDYDDRGPRLAEIYWSDDSAKVGVLVCDLYRTPVLFSYDTINRRMLPASAGEAGIRSNLVRRYRLTAAELAAFGGDPIAWACSDDWGPARRFRALTASSGMLPTVSP